MTSFGSIGGLMIGILGLAITAYGLDVHGPHSSQAFSLGVVGIAAGGIIVWMSNKKQHNHILTPKYETESQKIGSDADPIKYRNLYEGSPVLQRTVNTAGIILECNQAYVKNFGYSKYDILGKSLFDHTAEKSMEDMQKTFETWKTSGRVENIEIWFKRKDGSIFPGLISANNIHDDKGKLIGSNTVIRDISEIYQAHRVLGEHERQKIQLEELKKIDTTKEEFYMMVAKECQIPIVPIRKYSKILRDVPISSLDEKQSEAVNEIYDNAARLDQLMHDIIDVQKLNGNTMEFKKEKFAVDDFMNEVVKSCMSMMGDKNIEFVNSTSIKNSITSDKTRLSEIFYNLIQNAVDFVPTTGGRIEIKAKEEGDFILFYVKDNGSGILEKRKDQVFKKFYQVDISFKRKYGGSGFGLVICKGIVENLGGKIWFESKEGEGTVFYFSIPK
ncbi:PAS domain-containing sensor histidine kinase [Candidatus Nitrosotalea okcheonensis]|uniref:histidine kinase n=1 Tax=Candidatus Nitrosotalea okcheonensis TaxID=1903276 RepID=A0A2H1FG42_9ARCH|nr:PAS domain-containing sensor histidine kinase [Candidatus Nitrosotalea okcheonensis]SMH71739.1 putative Histidine kinase [Candidatus Nitrosotalea okcheonensis]